MKPPPGSQCHHNAHGTEWLAFLRERCPAAPGGPHSRAESPEGPAFLCVPCSSPLCVLSGALSLFNPEMSFPRLVGPGHLLRSLLHPAWVLVSDPPLSSASVPPRSLDAGTFILTDLTGVRTWHLLALRRDALSLFLSAKLWSNFLPLLEVVALSVVPFFLPYP